MRYWHPFSDAVARAVRAWGPDEIVLLPLYPQYSTTTTGSSLTAWREAAARVGLVAPTTALCCYPTDAGIRRRDRRRACAPPTQDGARAARSGDRAAGAVLRARPAGSDRARRRSVPVADRADRRRGAGGMGRSDAGLGDLLSVAGDAAALDRAEHRCEIERAAHDGVGRAGGADRLRLGAFGNAGGARCRLPQRWRNGLRCAGLFPGPDAELDAAFIAALAELVRHAPHARGRAVQPCRRTDLSARPRLPDRSPARAA